MPSNSASFFRPSVLLLWSVGPFVYRLWVRGAVSFDARCFHILLLVTIADSLWFMSSVVPMSTNSHHRVAVMFVVASAVSLVLGKFLLLGIGLPGAAWALLAVGVFMVWLVLQAALRQLQDTPADFAAAILRFPKWRSLAPRSRDTIAANRTPLVSVAENKD